MKMAMLVVLILATSVLGYTALGTVIEPGEAGGPGNAGPHAFSEILYAFASQTGNNGSAFGSLTGNVPFYNLAGGFAMLIGRFGMIVPILAIAGSMAAKRRVAPSLGTFPTTGADLRRPAHRRRDHRRRPDLLPGARPRADRRAAPPQRRKGFLRCPVAKFSIDLDRGTRRFQRNALRGGQKPEATPPVKPRGIFDPTLLRAAIPQALRKLDPRELIRNPVIFVVEITAVLVTLLIGLNVDRHRQRRGPGRSRLPGPDRRLAVVHGPVRHVRRGRRRGSRAGAGVDPPQDALRVDRPPAAGRRLARGRRLVRAASRRPHRRPRRARRSPATATSSRASATSTRRRSPASRRRSSRSPAPTSGARSPAGPQLVSDELVDPHHGQPGRDLPRPDDRARRGREAPAHPQRDRAVDPVAAA